MRAKQLAWCCGVCGCPQLVAHGLCRSCYDRRRHSRQDFGGYRETVLARDVCCQLCLSATQLLVPHRRPGKNAPALHIALCRRCHAPVHHRRRLPGFYSDLFFRLWRELHPRAPAQLRLPLSSP